MSGGTENFNTLPILIRLSLDIIVYQNFVDLKKLFTLNIVSLTQMKMNVLYD